MINDGCYDGPKPGFRKGLACSGQVIISLEEKHSKAHIIAAFDKSSENGGVSIARFHYQEHKAYQKTIDSCLYHLITIMLAMSNNIK